MGALRMGYKISFLLAFLCLTISCASNASAQQVENSAKPDPMPTDLYTGEASESSLGAAMTGAIGQALKAAVIDRVGAERERGQSAKLNGTIYGQRVQNEFIYRESIKTLTREARGSLYRYALSVRVNVEKLELALAREGLLEKTSPELIVAADQELLSGPSRQQKVVIEKMAANLLYMVYYKEGSTEDPAILKAAVSSANSWLLENGYSLVEFETIEKLKKDSRIVYETSTGEILGPIDWIAQDQGVDLVLELDISTTARSQGRSHTASANLVINMKDPSTAKLMGSVSSSNPPVQSAVDQFDARFKAVASGVYFSLPQAVEQSKKELLKQMERGVRYAIELQNTPDTKTTIDFRSKIRLDENVVSVKEISKTKAKTYLEVYYYGTADDLEELAFEAAGSVVGFEDFDVVMKKGRNLVFDTGM